MKHLGEIYKGLTFSEAAKNADIKRHMERERHLRNMIRESDEAGDKICADAYRYLLNQLLASKVEVVSKIGKK